MAMKRNGLLDSGLALGWKFGASLIGIGLLLKLIGQEAGALTVLYYLVFPIWLCIWAIANAWRHGLGFRFLPAFGAGTLASLIGSTLYSVWVIINTRLVFRGPIPALQQAMEDIERRQAAGEAVASAAILERSMESPEFFAALVIIQLTVWGLVWSLMAAAVALIVRRRISA